MAVETIVVLDADGKIPIAEIPTGSTSTTVPLGNHTHAGGGGDMLKSTYDPNDDGVIAKAQLDADLANTSGTNTGDQTLAGLGGIAHSLATAINDFLVASGAGAFVKKTLAEVKTILDWAADIATHAALSATHGRTNIDGVTERDAAISTHASLATEVHGAGASTLETIVGSQAKVDTHAGAADPHTGYVLESLFDAQSILQATSDNVPVALTVGQQTVVGRITGGNIVALTVAQLATLALSAALPEDTFIILDAAISGTGHASGIVEAGTLGATVAYGEVVYFKALDSQWYLAKADATATSGAVKIGLCLVAGNDNDATVILLYGKINAATVFPSFTISAPVFISAATAGQLTSTAPTGTTNFVVRIIGYGNTADELFFCPDNTYLELA